MAKKSSKNQPKQPNSASRVNTTEITSTPITTPTHIVFRNFIKLAEIDTINTFLTATTSTLESENIKLLWERAYEEGYENGRKVVLPVLQRSRTKLEEKLEEGIRRGKDLGREEGYNVAKEGFDRIVRALKAREAPKTCTIDADTQMDPQTTATTSISIQTNPITLAVASPPSELPENRKNSKMSSMSEISPSIAVFSSSTQSVISSELVTPAVVASALETRPKVVEIGHSRIRKKPENLYHKRNTVEYRDFFFTDAIRCHIGLTTLSYACRST
jgi:hypothetical protein